MLSQNFGIHNGNGQEPPRLNSKMYHKKMFIEHVGRPFIEAFSGVTEFAAAKIVILVSGLPAILALDLFATPELWWKGLLYLVVFDWVGGVADAFYRRNFSWNIATRKWYQATGYLLVCGAAAVLSNTFPSVFYYFQFVVYATFFLKEFISLLRTFRLIAMFEVMWDMLSKKDFSLNSFRNFKNKVDRRHEKNREAEEQRILQHEVRRQQQYQEETAQG